MTEARLTLAVPLGDLAITAPLPEFLSQRNVEAVMGIPARVYLETIREDDFPLKVYPLGKLRLVDRVSFAAWLRAPRSAVKAAAPRPGAPANDAPSKPTAESVLAELDCERTSSPARKAQ